MTQKNISRAAPRRIGRTPYLLQRGRAREARAWPNAQARVLAHRPWYLPSTANLRDLLLARSGDRAGACSRSDQPGTPQAATRRWRGTGQPTRRGDWRSERGHVDADLDDQHFGGALLDAWDGPQQVTLAGERGDPFLDLCGEAVDGFVEEVNVGEDLPDDEGVFCVEAPASASRSARIFLRSCPRARSGVRSRRWFRRRARRACRGRICRGCPSRHSRA